jgi:hypothetical protein
MEDRIVEFSATIVREIYSNIDYRICAVQIVDTDDIVHKNKYGNVSIKGEFPELMDVANYEIIAKETQDKYGIGYEVLSITTALPEGYEACNMYLQEGFATARQAEILLNAYPNIIDMILNNEHVDLTKTKGIKQKTFDKIKWKDFRKIRNYKHSKTVIRI